MNDRETPVCLKCNEDIEIVDGDIIDGTLEIESPMLDNMFICVTCRYFGVDDKPRVPDFSTFEDRLCPEEKKAYFIGMSKLIAELKDYGYGVPYWNIEYDVSLKVFCDLCEQKAYLEEFPSNWSDMESEAQYAYMNKQVSEGNIGAWKDNDMSIEEWVITCTRCTSSGDNK